jgi:hypothetical protein
LSTIGENNSFTTRFRGNGYEVSTLTGRASFAQSMPERIRISYSICMTSIDLFIAHDKKYFQDAELIRRGQLKLCKTPRR